MAKLQHLAAEQLRIRGGNAKSGATALQPPEVSFEVSNPATRHSESLEQPVAIV